MRDVGDGDADEMAARIARVRIRHGMHRVVVILGVGRIDSDEGHVAPVLASFPRRGACGLRFGDERVAEHLRDAVSMDRNQADRPFALERA